MTIREEIQITDLEPSIEGGEDIKYVVQIRGIDGTGRPGPWSEPLEFNSPQQIPSLESFNYVPGEDGWKLDNDGTFEVNDAFIRGELQSSNYQEGVEGWILKNTGDVEFSNGEFRGSLKIGQNTFNVDPNGNLFIGGSTFNNSPFAVNTNGQIAAMSISGNFIEANTITASQIASNTITAGQIAANTITASQIASNTIRANEIRAGTITANEIASDYVYAGAIDADQITTGTLNADNVTISGTLSAVTLDGVTGSFSGSLTATVTQANSINTPIVGSPSGESLSLIGSSGATLLGRGMVLISSSQQNITLLAGGGDVNISQSNLRINGSLRVDALADFETTIRNKGMFTGTGVNVVAAGTAFVLRRESSSIRYKENIRDAEKLPNLLKVRPVIFDFKKPEDEETQQDKDVYGAIAEELHDLGLSELVYYLDGQPETIQYKNIGLALIPYVKELYDRIEELERKLNGN